MSARDANFHERRAVIAKVIWSQTPDGRLTFKGDLGGKPRQVTGGDNSAETKTKLVDLAMAMDRES